LGPPACGPALRLFESVDTGCNIALTFDPTVIEHDHNRGVIPWQSNSIAFEARPLHIAQAPFPFTENGRK
jgi:hypothetical protein